MGLRGFIVLDYEEAEVVHKLQMERASVTPRRLAITGDVRGTHRAHDALMKNKTAAVESARFGRSA